MASLQGKASAILPCERVAINFGTAEMSGILSTYGEKHMIALRFPYQSPNRGHPQNYAWPKAVGKIRSRNWRRVQPTVSASIRHPH